MLGIKIGIEARKALREWNAKNYGRGLSEEGIVQDPEVIERLQLLRLPSETLDDTIIRLCSQGGAVPQ